MVNIAQRHCLASLWKMYLKAASPLALPRLPLFGKCFLAFECVHFNDCLQTEGFTVLSFAIKLTF